MLSLLRRIPRGRAHLAALFSLISLIPHPAWSQSPGQSPGSQPSWAPLQALVEEFFLADAVRSEDQGEVQITGSVEGLRHQGSNAGLELEYGVTDRLQFSFETPYGIQQRSLSETPEGWTTVSMGGLYQFIRSDHPFALSTAFTVEIPVNSRGELGYEPEVLLAKGVGRSQLHFDLGGEFSDDDKSWYYNAAWVRPVTRRWLTTFEVDGRRTNGANGVYLTPGIYRHWFPRFARRVEAGAGVLTGIGPAASHFGLAANLTVEVGGDDD